MKTSFLKVAFSSLFGVMMLFACSDSPTPPPPPPPPPPDDMVVYTDATAEYLEFMHGKNGATYTLTFYKDCGYDQFSLQPKGGPGSFIRLEMNTELPSQDPKEEHRIGEGTYEILSSKVNLDPPVFTFYEGYSAGIEGFFNGSFLGELDDRGNTTVSLIKGGTFILAKEGDKYVINGAFELENGDPLKFTYNGKWKMYDRRTDGENPPPFKGMFVTASAAYQGDFYNNGSGMLLLSLLDMKFDKYDNLIMPGYRLALDFNIPLVTSPSDITLPVGNYPIRVNDEHSEVGIINGGFETEEFFAGSYWTIYNTYGMETPILVPSGTCSVSKSGDNYTITTTFELSNGQELTGHYEGPITFFDRSHLSLIDRDVVLNDITNGKLNFFGALSYYADEAYNWVVDLSTSDGRGVSLDILADDAYITELPAGTYNVVERLANAYLKPFTFIWGHLIFGNMPIGTWYFEHNQAQAPLVAGTVTVLRDGENYSFEFDLVDDYPYGDPHRVSGSYSGPMVYEDLSEGWLHNNTAKATRMNKPVRTSVYKYVEEH